MMRITDDGSWRKFTHAVYLAAGRHELRVISAGCEVLADDQLIGAGPGLQIIKLSLLEPRRLEIISGGEVWYWMPVAPVAAPCRGTTYAMLMPERVPVPPEIVRMMQVQRLNSERREQMLMDALAKANART